MIALYIILAIILFGVLIAVHEFGHFAAAKLCGVRVEEFSIGMGPAIFKKQKGETLYSLRCFPFGGFCAMTGEDEESEDPRAFTNQTPLKKIFILCAGAFMNFIAGLIIVMILYSGAAAFRAPIIAGFMDGCPYQGENGFMEGDRIYSIDGQRILQYYDVEDFLSYGDGTYDIVIIRDGKKLKLEDFRFVPVSFEGYDKEYYGIQMGYETATVGAKLRNSWDTSMEFGRWVFLGLRQLVSGEASVSELSGPVGIVGLMAETGENAQSVSDALYQMFYLYAFIAVNLALMNLLPLPALDGGRVFLVLVTAVIEAITRKRLNPKYEGYIHAAGMVLLLALMAFVMFNDIVRIVTK